MRTKAWLVLELKSKRGYDTLHVKGVRKTRPQGEMAIEVELDVPPEILYPKVEALIEYAGQVQLDIGEEEE